MDRERRRFWTLASAALLSGLVLRLWFVHHMAMVQGDSLVYGDIAKNLLRHGVYGLSQGSTPQVKFGISPTLIRLPGYPFFLAACFLLFGLEHYHSVLYMQVGADLLTCCLASALAGRIFGRRAASAVLWLAALCPFTASYSGIALSETLVLTTIALALYCFARWQDAGLRIDRWLWIVAVSLAYSVLLRPEQVLFAAAVVFGMLWTCLIGRHGSIVRACRPAFAAAFCVALPLLLWTARNWRTFHVIQPLVPKYANDPGELPPFGFSRWYRTWAIDFASTESVYWNYPGDRIDPGNLPTRAFDVGSPAASDDLHSRTTALLASYNAARSPEVSAKMDARFNAFGVERIHAHPVLYYVGLPVSRLLNMALRPRTEMMNIPLDWWNYRVHRSKTIFAASYAALNLAYFAIGVAGLFAWKRRGWLSDPPQTDPNNFRELAFAMALTLILRSALLLTLDNSEPRYTLEFFPILFAWAGALFAESRTIAE